MSHTGALSNNRTTNKCQAPVLALALCYPFFLMIITDRTWVMMTQDEIEKAAKLKAKESRAVAALLRAARSLPRGITVEVDDDGMIVRKQITREYFHNVATLKRRTLRNGVRFSDDG